MVKVFLAVCMFADIAISSRIDMILNQELLENSENPELLLGLMTNALQHIRPDPKRVLQGEMTIQLVGHNMTLETAGFWEMREWVPIVDEKDDWPHPLSRRNQKKSKILAWGWEHSAARAESLLEAIQELSHGEVDLGSASSIISLIENISNPVGESPLSEITGRSEYNSFGGIEAVLFSAIRLQLKQLHCELLKLQIKNGDLSNHKKLVSNMVAGLEGFEVIWDRSLENQTDSYHWGDDEDPAQFVIVLKPSLHQRLRDLGLLYIDPVIPYWPLFSRK